MWLSKFLDLKDDLKSMSDEIKNSLFTARKKPQLTPLEFTILESIFNNKEISGYDLIQNLNRHFAGTWRAKSGTVYPILSKLVKNGFLSVKTIKSPLGPLKKVYFLTIAAEEVIKFKVNKNFKDQVKFIENFLIELSSIYIHSYPEEEQAEQTVGIQGLIRDTFNNIFERIPLGVAFKTKCSECNAEIDRNNARHCSFCGASLFPGKDDEVDDFKSAEILNGSP